MRDQNLVVDNQFWPCEHIVQMLHLAVDEEHDRPDQDRDFDEVNEPLSADTAALGTHEEAPAEVVILTLGTQDTLVAGCTLSHKVCGVAAETSFEQGTLIEDFIFLVSAPPARLWDNVCAAVAESVIIARFADLLEL